MQVHGIGEAEIGIGAIKVLEVPGNQALPGILFTRSLCIDDEDQGDLDSGGLERFAEEAEL
jgi:hypothetical protein